ncbi:MAG TPA: acyl carrier protein [Paracoccaceae bacterium]|nr:acyl carrier protein [Paracoccaceae bacterium]
MTAEEIEREVIALLAQHVRNGHVPGPETRVMADTGMDSVAVMDFVLDLEEALDIDIPLDRLAEARTVADVVREVAGLTAPGGDGKETTA